MKMSEIKEEAWKARAHAIPTKMVPDWDALFQSLEASGWLVLEPPAIDHRETTLGVLESKLIRDFRNWAINNKSLSIQFRRIGEYRWYLTVGAPCLSTRQRRRVAANG